MKAEAILQRDDNYQATGKPNASPPAPAEYLGMHSSEVKERN